MAEGFTDEHLSALLQSIQITEQDAKFNQDKPPSGIFSAVRMDLMHKCLLTFDPQKVFDRIQSIESNRTVLKKELKYMFKLYLIFKDNPESAAIIPLSGLLKKYKLDLLHGPNIFNFNFADLLFTFPDIYYNVIKSDFFSQLGAPLLKYYKNFQMLHFNIGILGMLPKGQKYGGFVKALIHINMNESKSSGFSEEFLAFCRCIYNSTVTPHDKREKWFAKLKIDEKDCVLWSAFFDTLFPEHTDIHKYFGQIA